MRQRLIPLNVVFRVETRFHMLLVGNTDDLGNGRVFGGSTFSEPNLILLAVLLPAVRRIADFCTPQPSSAALRTAHLAGAVLVSWHAANAALMRDGIFLLAALVGLGLLVVVAIRLLNPKIDSVADVKRFVGCAPIAALPDFAEVPDDVADECLLRLASAIALASKGGDLNRCIFVGAGSADGVTALASRLRDVTEARRKRASAAGSGMAAARLQRTRADDDDNARSTALLQRVVREAQAGNGVSNGSDAPIAVQAGSELSARKGDCTIVVIESGVTKRAELRKTVRSLQKSHPRSLRFVLNSVSLNKAGPAFRRAIEEIALHARLHNRRVERITTRDTDATVEAVPESAHVAQKIELRSDKKSSTIAASERIEENPPAQVESAGPATAPRSLFDVYAEDVQRAAPHLMQQESKAAQEIPWWTAETPALPDSALTQRRIAIGGTLPAAQNGEKSKDVAEERPKPPGEDAQLLTPLSGLRGALFSSGIRKLDMVKRGVQRNAEAEALLKQIEPFEPLIESACGATRPAEAARAEVVRVVPVGREASPEKKDPPAPEKKAVTSETGSGEAAAHANGRSKSSGKSAFAPPDVAKQGKSNGRGSGRETLGDVQILPSKKGQYRKTT